MSLGKKSVLFILLILFADQILKIWVKTHMAIGQEITFSETGEFFISLKITEWHLEWKWEENQVNLF